MIVDVHTHLGGVKSGGKCLCGWVYVSADDLLCYMDACGISKAIVLPIEKVPNISEDLLLTEDILKACEVDGTRLIPFCTVDPNAEDIEKKIAMHFEKGCRGFGEHRVGLPVDHALNMRIYTTCERLGIPILLELADEYNYGFESFTKVVSMFPRLTFIAHGPAWWREISGDPDRTKVYPTGPVKAGGLVEEILSEKENVYADISATSGYNALSRDPAFSRDFLVRLNGKLIFGTDFPCIDPEGRQDGPNRRHLSLLHELIHGDKLDRILSGNILAILGL